MSKYGIDDVGRLLQEVVQDQAGDSDAQSDLVREFYSLGAEHRVILWMFAEGHLGTTIGKIMWGHADGRRASKELTAGLRELQKRMNGEWPS